MTPIERAAEAICDSRPHGGGGSEVVYEDAEDCARAVFESIDQREIVLVIDRIDADHDLESGDLASPQEYADTDTAHAVALEREAIAAWHESEADWYATFDPGWHRRAKWAKFHRESAHSIRNGAHNPLEETKR